MTHHDYTTYYIRALRLQDCLFFSIFLNSPILMQVSEMTDLRLSFMLSPFSADLRLRFDKIILKRMCNFEAIITSSQSHYMEVYDRCRAQLLDTHQPGQPLPLIYLSGVFCVLILGIIGSPVTDGRTFVHKHRVVKHMVGVYYTLAKHALSVVKVIIKWNMVYIVRYTKYRIFPYMFLPYFNGVFNNVCVHVKCFGTWITSSWNWCPLWNNVEQCVASKPVSLLLTVNHTKTQILTVSTALLLLASIYYPLLKSYVFSLILMYHIL